MSLYLKFLKCYYKTCLTPSLPGVGTSNWKYILQAQGMLWNVECYGQRKSCPLPPQTDRERSLTEKSIETERIEEEERTDGQRMEKKTTPFYLKLSSLSSSSPSVSFTVQPKHTVIPQRASLTFCLHLACLVRSSRHGMWSSTVSRWVSSADAHSGVWLPYQWQVMMWFHYSWDYRQETPGTHSLHMTVHLSYLRPSHCLRLHDLHNKTRALIRVIFC